MGYYWTCEPSFGHIVHPDGSFAALMYNPIFRNDTIHDMLDEASAVVLGRVQFC